MNPGRRSAASGPLNDVPHRPAGPSLRCILPGFIAAPSGFVMTSYEEPPDLAVRGAWNRGSDPAYAPSRDQIIAMAAEMLAEPAWDMGSLLEPQPSTRPQAPQGVSGC